ncbi:outer membrane beta-barrel protein [Methylomicrobium album]|uniref:Outer membrane protein beta-barrel domain-containing protein n=1 Tax=Methylomicrobium album BG8 TaxID=686340 RepID=H8GNA2_METAL|nr:outer membrane beta-barrel protein [Methylomicrobium album]EIC28331.1 hypothetical protein Metal_0480 [Methylomicrobium album BG8]
MNINKLATVLVAVSSLGISAVSQASGEAGDIYVAPFGSYLHPGGDTQASDGWGAGAGVGMVINRYFNVEARGFWHNYRNDIPCCGGGETDLLGASLDGQFYFMRDRFSPYLVASLGGMRTELTSRYFNTHATSFIFEAGGGGSFTITDNFSLRGDVRYRINTLPSNVGGEGVLNDLVVNLGFEFKLGQL